ncbi:MAG: transglutaminase family protein [Myxococcales bacterium]
MSRSRWAWLAAAGSGGLSLAVYIGSSFERHAHSAIPASVEEMLTWPDDDLDFGLAALVLTKRYFPKTDIQAELAELDDYALEVRATLSGRGDHDEPPTRIGAINTTLYLRHGFQYDHSDELARRMENRLLGTLLAKKSGSCANLYQLYYAVAERLGFPIDVALADQHFYVRYELPGGGHQNIEPTSGGGSSTDDELVADMEIPGAAVRYGNLLRPLSKREAIALLLEEQSVEDVRRGNWAEGNRIIQELTKLLPRSAEVWFDFALTEAHQAKMLKSFGEKRAADVAALTHLALEHARRAKDLGITKPLTPGYEERQRQIALWRKVDPERAKKEPVRDQDWDPVAVIASVANGQPPPTDPEDALSPGDLADRLNALQKGPSLAAVSDLANRANIATGAEQARLLSQLAGVPPPPSSPLNPSLPSASIVEVP